MATSLYKIKINKVEKNKVDLTVDMINPDAGTIPTTETFALNILAECWKKMEKGYFFSKESYLPIDKEQGKDRAKNAKGAALMDTLYVQANGGYKKLLTKEEIEAWNGTGSYMTDIDGSISIHTGKDRKSFKKAATSYIKNLQTRDISKTEKQMVFDVTDESLTEFILEGSWWETAIWQ